MAILKSSKMDAVWFLNIMKMFMRSLTAPNVFFGIRLQYLKEDGISATFFCDGASQIVDAKKRRYTTRPLNEFTVEMIHQMWKIRRFHWEVEVYAYSNMMDDPITTLAFRSYGPVVEITHEENGLIPTSAIFLLLSDMGNVEILASDNRSLSKHIDWTREGLHLSLSGPRFACLE